MRALKSFQPYQWVYKVLEIRKLSNLVLPRITLFLSVKTIFKCHCEMRNRKLFLILFNKMRSTLLIFNIDLLFS